MRRRLDPDAARRMGGMIADFKPDVSTKMLDLYDLFPHQRKGETLFVQSRSPRKVRMSLPRVKWLESADV